MTPEIKKLLWTFFILSSVYLAFPILLAKINLPLIPPTVLIVGDFSSNESFGSNVYKGIQNAENSLNRRKTNFKIKKISYNSITSKNIASKIGSQEYERLKNDLESQLAKAFASENIIGIISANTSQTVQIVLETGRLFNVPVLVTVSTNDQVLVEYKNIAFRLLARDSQQAEAIIDWCNSFKGEIVFGLLYDPVRYGEGLQSSLIANEDIFRFIPFPVGTTTDVVGTLQYGSISGVNAWVVVGYKQQAVEVLIKKRHLKIPGPVLLSDGAYGSWLRDLSTDSVYLSFPMTDVDVNKRDALSQSSKEKNFGYGTFGYDSYIILDESVQLLNDDILPKYKLFEIIPEIAENLSQSGKLMQKYKFVSGENTYSCFKIYEVGNGIIP